MNQSVYRKDFQDPRGIARLWKFHLDLDENPKSKFEYNEENGRARGIVEEESIKRHHHEESGSNDCIERTQSDMNVTKNQQDLRNSMKAKSMMLLSSKKEDSSEVVRRCLLSYFFSPKYFM